LPEFKSGLVVCANPIASRAGASVLKKGGNAIDAAVTTAHALGVAAPAFSGIGGGGFALIWLAREAKAFFVDYRERAPLAAREDMFILTSSGRVRRDENSIGYKAVAIPTALAGHAAILEKYGTMRLGDTLEPAVRCARRGFRVGRALAYAWKLSANKLKRFKYSKETYLLSGRAYGLNQKIKLPQLAKTLATIASKGIDEFYDGTFSKKILDDMAQNGGLLASRDFERYMPTTREPVRGSYKDYEIISAPPPSSGGAIILQALNMLKNYDLKRYGPNSTPALHILAEALTRSYRSCRARISDPDFIEPISDLLSEDFAKELASTIDPKTVSLPDETTNPPLMPASNTTHLVTVDSERNVVSLTESVECYFGSGVTVPGTGVILNDTMHDFEPKPHTLNSVTPWKIPMSSMSPTIVLKEGRPIMALGSAGGPRIPSSTLQVLLNVIDFGLGLEDAVAAPRIHVHGNLVQLENTMNREVMSGLRKLGHKVEVKRLMDKQNLGLYFGGVHAAQLLQNSTLRGAADPRRDGMALGYS
jgi:gamma-glutamyltranspeptidase/glutathione hydrolase